MKAVTRTAVSGGPFMLESLYFRSFGERALLDQGRRSRVGEEDRLRNEHHSEGRA